MLVQTEKLYEKDCHLKQFQAQVISCEKQGEEYHILLDRTAFFPEGGGQAGDTGRLNHVKVTDVQQLKQGIVHIAAGPLEAGETVTGELDYEVRFDRMQQHTGEHIVSGLVHQMYGYDNIGFHLGSLEVTMDFNGVISAEALKKVERLANQAVFEDIPVEISQPGPEELQELDYRSKIDILEQVRLITIAGYDSCACCAPHLGRTGEIGLIKITGAKKYKGGTRVSMKSGFRALEYCNQIEQNVNQISALLSAKPEETAAAVERVKEEQYQLHGQLLEKNRQLVDYKVAAIPPGTGDYLFFEANLEAGQMREMVNQGIARCNGICGVFSGDDQAGYRYILGSKNHDVRTASKKLSEELGAKGGGKPEMVQGSVTAQQEKIKALLMQS